jgi:transposase
MDMPMPSGRKQEVEVITELQDAMRRIRRLEAALGRKTLENEILKEAVDLPREKSGLRARLSCPGTTSEAGL